MLSILKLKRLVPFLLLFYRIFMKKREKKKGKREKKKKRKNRYNWKWNEIEWITWKCIFLPVILYFGYLFYCYDFFINRGMHGCGCESAKLPPPRLGQSSPSPGSDCRPSSRPLHGAFFLRLVPVHVHQYAGHDDAGRRDCGHSAGSDTDFTATSTGSGEGAGREQRPRSRGWIGWE